MKSTTNNSASTNLKGKSIIFTKRKYKPITALTLRKMLAIPVKRVRKFPAKFPNQKEMVLK